MSDCVLPACRSDMKLLLECSDAGRELFPFVTKPIAPDLWLPSLRTSRSFRSPLPSGRVCRKALTYGLCRLCVPRACRVQGPVWLRCLPTRCLHVLSVLLPVCSSPPALPVPACFAARHPVPGLYEFPLQLLNRFGGGSFPVKNVVDGVGNRHVYIELLVYLVDTCR